MIDWYDDKLERKQKMTKRSITIAVNKLMKFSHEQQRDMVDAAIEGQWKGLWELKDKSRQPGKSAPVVDQCEEGRMEQQRKFNKQAAAYIESDENREHCRLEREAEAAEQARLKDPEFDKLSTKEKRQRCQEAKRRLLSR